MLSSRLPAAWRGRSGLALVVVLSALACGEQATSDCQGTQCSSGGAGGTDAVGDGGTTSTATGDTTASNAGGASAGGASAGGASAGGQGASGGAGSGTGGSTLTSGGTGGGAPLVPGSEHCTATTFTVSEGYVDNGTVCGHAWTYTHADGASVEPPCDGGPCFTGDELCISGELPASDTPSEILFGFNVAQARDAVGSPPAFSLGGSGVTIDFTRGGFEGEVRLLLDAGEKYCASLTSGKKLLWSDFSVGCWEGGPMSPAFEAGTAIKTFLLQLNGNDQEQSFSDFCVSRITVHP